MEQEQKKFKHTLNLPKTDFPIRAHYKQFDAELLARWEAYKLYHKTFTTHAPSKKYILHDGPPYANGNIHLGHAYNKILKDFVTKSRRMFGYHTPVTPGWDCHGLPIELKVTSMHPNLDKTKLKAECRAYAQHWLDIQRKEFKQLGVLMNWEQPYITMHPTYEAKTIQAFGSLVEQGYITRKNKTIPWCAHCKTVLAQAEIEHKERKDPSIYVLFDLTEQSAQEQLGLEHASLVVWTTTPWTLPLNKAILIKPEATYAIIKYGSQHLLVGAEVAPHIVQLLKDQAATDAEKEPITIIKKIAAEQLKDITIQHPFINRSVPLIFDESVGTNEGTAFVHCAPGCGPIDYEIGIKNCLDIYSPISAHGTYTAEVEIPELVGMPVTNGQIWVIKTLATAKKLLLKKNIKHSYPHCWRCETGLIFRATPQWFIDLQTIPVTNTTNTLSMKEKALDALESMHFTPAKSKNFLKAAIESRWEWCISRQRIWGVPIPALLCTQCDQLYINKTLIDHVVAGVKKHGIEYWDTVTVDQLLPKDQSCTVCNNSVFKKETDILDVWFDSGISHYAVLYDNPDLAYPADIYLEGLDQHRGWFQSSLLTSVVIEKQTAMKQIATHGYTVDAKGQKMSKSRGNVVLPSEIIDKLGTDGLRLWVSSIDFSSDPVVSETLLTNIKEVNRKIRNTARFLLSNLFDFNIAHDAIAPNNLIPIDHYALLKLNNFNAQVIQHYLANDFTAVFHALTDYTIVELSAFYLDIIKDRLYTEQVDGHTRRSAQTVCWFILDTLTKLIAPILSFTAELLSDHFQENKQLSIHEQLFNNPKLLLDMCVQPDIFDAQSYTRQTPAGKLISTKQQLTDILDNATVAHYLEQWRIVKTIRSALLKKIEIERTTGTIKHSLEAQVILYIDPTSLYGQALNTLKKLYAQFNPIHFWREVLIVSQVTLTDNNNLTPTELKGVHADIEHADGVKCPRCWQWDITTHADQLCSRCQQILV